MKIVVIVRTRDEEHRIGQFCSAYRNADHILIADGGSIDKTIEIAKMFDNVSIRNYDKRIELANGYWRNNDSDHANFLIAWANELKPDWIIYDDCDCRPNYLLKQHYRLLLKNAPEDFVMVTRFYLWGMNQHFPYMAKPDSMHEKFEPSLWAWRGNQDFWTVDVPPAYTFRIGNLPVKDLHYDAKTLDLFPPYALIHYSWDDPVRVDKKVETYRNSGLIPNMRHPLQMGGPLELLPPYVYE